VRTADEQGGAERAALAIALRGKHARRILGRRSDHLEDGRCHSVSPLRVKAVSVAAATPGTAVTGPPADCRLPLHAILITKAQQDMQYLETAD